MKTAGSKDLHITSSNFDEPAGVALVSKSDFVLAIHGEGSEHVEVVYLGGRDIELREAIAHELTAAGFEARLHDNPKLQGTSLANICNRGEKNRGVQLELSEGLRRTFFASLKSVDRNHPTAAFSSFVAAVGRALLKVSMPAI